MRFFNVQARNGMKFLMLFGGVSGTLIASGNRYDPPLPPTLEMPVVPEHIDWAFKDRFAVPEIDAEGPSGDEQRALDLRAPVALISTLDEIRLEVKGREGFVRFTGEAYRPEKLWPLVQALLKSADISVTETAPMVLESGWYLLGLSMEGWSLEGRMRFCCAAEAGSDGLITMELLDLRRTVVLVQGEAPEIPEPLAEISMDNTRLVNRLVSSEVNWFSGALADELVDLDSTGESLEESPWLLTAQLDRTGMPAMLVDAEFSKVWSRLPRFLEAMHFEVHERYRSKGLLELRYVPPIESSVWATKGLPDPQSESFYCQLQVSDLGNRSLLQLLASDGLPFEVEDFAIWFPIFTAAGEQGLGV